MIPRRDAEEPLLSLSGSPELRALFDTYRARDDLIRAFPEVLRGDLRRLLTWAVTYGITNDPSRPLLERYADAYRAQLRSPWTAQDMSSEHKVYLFAAYLGQRFGCRHLVDLGCHSPTDLVELSSKFQITVVGSGPQFDRCRERYGTLGTWIEEEIDQPKWIRVPENILNQAILICAGTTLLQEESGYIIDNLKVLLEYAPICILSARDATETGDSGLVQLENLLRSRRLNLAFIGHASADASCQENVIAVIEKNANMAPKSMPKTCLPDFRVVAIMRAHNEEDIIVPSIRRLLDEGIQVYLFDNWSTDSTRELAQQFSGKGLIGIEAFPRDGPSKYYDPRTLLTRIESVTKQINADWFALQDVDEIRVSPWPGVGLRDAILRVDRAGFNCIDHTVIEFVPVDNSFRPGEDFESHFKYWEFARHTGYFNQIRTWKNFGQSVSLSQSAGHEVVFEGRRVYPYKFLLKHYPIRSQVHGDKKVLLDRKPRYDPQTRAMGWQNHYDHILEGHVFVRPCHELERFDENHFNKACLVQRLSGIGVSYVSPLCLW